MGLRRGIGLCIILVVATLNLAACATMGDPPPTLYKRLGGREGIALVVGDFVTNMDLVRDICEIYRVQGFKTQVLAASIRNPIHVIDAAKAGAHVVTIPFAVLEQLMKHPLTDIGLKKFLEDWAKLGEKI